MEDPDQETRKRSRKNPTPRKRPPDSSPTLLLAEAEIKQEPEDLNGTYGGLEATPQPDEATAGATKRPPRSRKRKNNQDTKRKPKVKKGADGPHEESAEKTPESPKGVRSSQRKRRKKEVCAVEVKDEPGDDGTYGTLDASTVASDDVSKTGVRKSDDGLGQPKKSKKVARKSEKEKTVAIDTKLSKEEERALKEEKKALKKIAKEAKDIEKAKKKEEKALRKVAKENGKKETNEGKKSKSKPSAEKGRNKSGEKRKCADNTHLPQSKKCKKSGEARNSIKSESCSEALPSKPQSVTEPGTCSDDAVCDPLVLDANSTVAQVDHVDNHHSLKTVSENVSEVPVKCVDNGENTQDSTDSKGDAAMRVSKEIDVKSGSKTKSTTTRTKKSKKSSSSLVKAKNSPLESGSIQDTKDSSDHRPASVSQSGSQEHPNSREVSRPSSRHSSHPASRDASRPGSPGSTHGVQGMEDIRLLTEQLTCLNRDSDHLNTVIHRKPTPRKRKKRSLDAKKCLQSTPVRGSPARGKTPHKSPWRALSLRRTPGKTPGLSLLVSPGLKVTPSSSNRSPARSKRTPSKGTIKRRLYAGMVSPEEGTVTPDKSRPGTSQDQQDTPNKPPLILDADDVYSPSLGDRLNIASEDEWEDTGEQVPEQDSIDTKLEEKSVKIDLTAKNVRSIIHQVITNEHVLDMVRNTLQEDGLESQLKEAIFEPRMTRSKVKEAMEKGNVPLPWTLSPIKSFGTTSYSGPQQFLEMSFSDNEEQDEEYRPTQDELEHATDDEESVCSQVSEFGSPRPPHTPILSAVASPCTSVTSEKQDMPLTPSSMGPPMTVHLPSLHRRNLTETLEKVQTAEERTIALRTRSKLPLTDTPLEEIESNFVAPDITPDMYDTECDNLDWKEFLATLTRGKSQDLNDTTEEGEDPEYNFLAEPENEDDEDFRNDKAVKIPKKELDELISELFEAYGGATVVDEDTQESQPAEMPANEDLPGSIHSPGPSSAPQAVTRSSPKRSPSPEREENYDASELQPSYPVQVPPLNFDPQLASIIASDIMRIKNTKDDPPPATPGSVGGEAAPSPAPDDLNPGSLTGPSVPRLTDTELVQLQDQIRKHVQLLAQTFIQSSADIHPVLKETQQTTKALLMEMKCLGEKTKLTNSYLHPPNLEGAIALTSHTDLRRKDPLTTQILEKYIRQKVMTKKAFHQYCLTYEQMDVFANSTVFLVPQMLPEYMLVGAPERKTRIAFTDAEDNLLAMGVDQFHHLEKKYVFIHKFLLPSKQREQIRFRHKNLKARVQGMNAISFWYREGRLPDFQKYTELEAEKDFREPTERDHELLPTWFEAYVKTKREIQLNMSGAMGLLGSAGLLEMPITPPPVRSGKPNHTPEFKRRHNSVYRKLPKPRRKDDELQSIAPKLSMTPINSPYSVTQIGNEFYMSSPSTVEIHSCPTTPGVASYGSHMDAHMEQQVMDKLMSAIDLPTAEAALPSQGNDPCVPLLVDSVAMSSSAEGTEEPVVMLTASQLKQLGINVDLMSPGPSTPGYQMVSTPTIAQSPYGQAMSSSILSSPCPSSVHMDTTLTPTSSKKSLISHAFSEATGIPVDDLENMIDVSQVLDQEQHVIGVDKLNSAMALLGGQTIGTWESLPTNQLPSSVAIEDVAQGVLPKHLHEGPRSSPRTLSEQLCSEGIHNVVEIPGESLDSEVAKIIETTTDISADQALGGSGSKAQDKTKDIAGPSQPSDSMAQKRSATPPNFPISYMPPILASPRSIIDESPTKSAIRIMAELAQLNTPPDKLSPMKWPHQSRPGFKSWSPAKPVKTAQKSPLRPLRPSGPVPTTPITIDLPKKQGPGRPSKGQLSPRRQDLNQHARAIAPKGLVLRTFVSPVKMAAASISAKARRKNASKPPAVRKLRTLLPKDDPPQTKTTETGRKATRSSNRKRANAKDTVQAAQTEPSGPVAANRGQKKKPDSDEDHLAKLMAASTTVRGAPKKGAATGTQKRGNRNKKEAMLKLLAPGLVENDPRRDERDTAFAQGYLIKVREALRSKPSNYVAFLKLLYDFGSSDRTPVQLYDDIRELLVDHPLLVSDFAGFLLPDQAKVCNCLMDNLGYKRGREFFRKLEVYFHKQPQQLQKILKVFVQWQGKPHADGLLTAVKPLLKGQQHLIDEFTRFFGTERPPESLKTDFEEITLGDSDDEAQVFDGFEEIRFPDADYEQDELYGTRLCPCHCHSDTTPLYAKRRMHCSDCSVKIVRGEVFMQTSERDVFTLLPAFQAASPKSTNPGANSDAAPEKPRNDEEAVENIPPAKKGQKAKKNAKSKIKVKLKLKRTAAKPKKSSSSKRTPASVSRPAPAVPVVAPNPLMANLIREDLPVAGVAVSPHVFSGEEALLSPEPMDGATSQMARDVPVKNVTGPTDFSGLRRAIQSQSNKGLHDSQDDSVIFNMGGTSRFRPQVEDDNTNFASRNSANVPQNSQPERVVESDNESNHTSNSPRPVPSEEEAEDTEGEEAELQWTREEDRLILETCQREGTGTATFQQIADHMQNKTADQVTSRFIRMMQMMTEGEDTVEVSDCEDEE